MGEDSNCMLLGAYQMKAFNFVSTKGSELKNEHTQTHTYITYSNYTYITY